MKEKMLRNKQRAGFQKPRVPQDEWTARLYEEYGLRPNPSLQEIEPIASRLLANPETFISGAELVLGRRVDAKDQEVTFVGAIPGLDGRDRFTFLLFQRAIEKAATA